MNLQIISAHILYLIRYPTINRLIKDLSADKVDTRVQAIEALGTIGAPAIPGLMAALHKDDRNFEFQEFENPYLRKAFIRVGEPAFQALLSALKPGSQMVRAATKTLAFWGDQRAVEPLIRAMLNRDIKLNGKLYIIGALGNLRDPRAIGPLRNMLNNRNEYFRNHAARALAEYGDPSLLPEICDALKTQGRNWSGLREGLPEIIRVLRRRSQQNDKEEEFEHYFNEVKALYSEKRLTF